MRSRIRPGAERTKQLKAWLGQLKPLCDAIDLILPHQCAACGVLVEGGAQVGFVAMGAIAEAEYRSYPNVVAAETLAWCYYKKARYADARRATDEAERLEALKRGCPVVLTTDSQYVMKGITEWMPKWKLNQWRTADKKPVKNQDLWLLLDELSGKHRIQWNWIKGHSGHRENEIADQLANQGISEARHATDRIRY